MKAIGKIRGALEALRWRVLEVEIPQVDGALSALAELEKAAREPVGDVMAPNTVRWDIPVRVGTKLYTTPPLDQHAPGMFTADEIKAAYMEAFERASFDVSGGRGSNRFGRWAESDTFKLVQERTK